MSKRYPIPADGEWVQPTMKGYKMRCCDCGLVHRINFRVLHWQKAVLIPHAKVQMQVERDNRSTGAVRRKRESSAREYRDRLTTAPAGVTGHRVRENVGGERPPPMSARDISGKAKGVLSRAASKTSEGSK